MIAFQFVSLTTKRGITMTLPPIIMEPDRGSLEDHFAVEADPMSGSMLIGGRVPSTKEMPPNCRDPPPRQARASARSLSFRPRIRNSRMHAQSVHKLNEAGKKAATEMIISRRQSGPLVEARSTTYSKAIVAA